MSSPPIPPLPGLLPGPAYAQSRREARGPRERQGIRSWARKWLLLILSWGGHVSRLADGRVAKAALHHRNLAWWRRQQAHAAVGLPAEVHPTGGAKHRWEGILELLWRWWPKGTPENLRLQWHTTRPPEAWPRTWEDLAEDREVWREAAQIFAGELAA